MTRMNFRSGEGSRPSRSSVPCLTNRKHIMKKLLDQFRSNPTDANRAKLQAYLRKHMMAICVASPEDQQYLKANGFSI